MRKGRPCGSSAAPRSGHCHVQRDEWVASAPDPWLPEVASVALVADVERPPLPSSERSYPRACSRECSGVREQSCSSACGSPSATRPDRIVGFSFIPHGFNARTVSAVTRTKSLYHMIGGEQEWLGGGWRSDNRILGRLPFPSHLLERVLLRLIAGCTIVATMGESGRASLIEHGVDPSRVRIVRPSVDTRRFEPSSSPVTRRYDVVTVGELIPRKRTADLLRAVAELRERRHGLQLAVVGEGALEAELRKLASEMEIGEQARLPGFREVVRSIYHAARVFVLTSAFEGLPIAMLEAMATGLPPVVADVGEIGGFDSRRRERAPLPCG